MKTKISNYIKLSSLVLAFCIVPLLSQAQAQQETSSATLFSFENSNVGKTFFTADWQVNSISNDFVSNTAGWGANLELNHFLTENVSIGVFLAWSTNNEYFPTQSYTSDTRTITTDMFRGIYQLPFGALARYHFNTGSSMFSPYVGLKIGANYSEQSVYLYLIQVQDNNWGFYVSPEIGVNIFPVTNQRFGFHIAGYYGYSTNSSDFGTVGSFDNLSNFGFRVGGTFRF